MPQQDNATAHTEWLTESHQQAQTGAMVWAQRADEAYEEAQRYNDRADSWTPSAAYASTIEHERNQAQTSLARSAEARQLAEMWARVAAVLVPPLEAVWSTLESTDG